MNQILTFEDFILNINNILSKKRKSVQFADGIKPGEGTSPSGGEELSSPPPFPRKLPKEKRYKKIKLPKKPKKKKIKVKVVKKVQSVEIDEVVDDDDNLPPPSPPPGSPPSHVFPSRVKTPVINNVHQYIGSIIQTGATSFPYRPPMSVMMNRHQPPPPSVYMPSGNFSGGKPFLFSFIIEYVFLNIMGKELRQRCFAFNFW